MFLWNWALSEHNLRTGEATNMTRSVTHKDILWGYIAQALNIGAGLILLPVILHYLPAEDVGLWFVFITLASLAQLLEFGFQPTLARNTAYIYAGAQSLTKHGLPPELTSNAPLNQQLLADLIAASRTIYRIVAGVAAIILLIGGTYYIWTLLTPEQNVPVALTAWVAFALGYIATFYYGYFNGLLQGRGDITSANKVVIITRGTFVALGAAAVMTGLGLPGLGGASLVASLIGRWVGRGYFFTSGHLEMNGLNKFKSNINNELIGTLWHNASRFGAVQVGAFLIQRANILLASSFLGLATAASYGMTITILMAVSSISMVICQIQVPHMNALQIQKRKNQLRGLYGAVNIISVLLFLAFSLLLLAFGNYFLDLISSQTKILPNTQLIVLFLIILLELNHGIAATYLMTKNEIPFVKPALWSGAFIISLGVLLVDHFGIWALILAQGLIQLIYNNWKWPILVIEDMGGKPIIIYYHGLRIIRLAIMKYATKFKKFRT